MFFFAKTYIYIFLTVLFSKGFLVSGSGNTPPQLSFNRNWNLVEDEPIGSVVDRITIQDDDDVDKVNLTLVEPRFNLTLVEPSFHCRGIFPEGFTFFRIDSNRRVILAKSLRGLAGQCLLVGLRAFDGGIPMKYDVKVSIRKPNQKHNLIPSGLSRSFNPGLPPPTFHRIAHIPSTANHGPPLLDLDPFTVWKVPENATLGAFVQKVEAETLSNSPLKFSIEPSDLVSIDSDSGDVTVVSSLLGKNGDHSLTVNVSDKHESISEKVKLRIVPTTEIDSLEDINKQRPTDATSIWIPSPSGERRSPELTEKSPKSPVTIIEKETESPALNHIEKKEKKKELIVMIVLTVLLLVVVLPLVAFVVWRWRKKHMAIATNKDTAVTYIKKRDSSSAHAIRRASDVSREGILGEIFSLVGLNRIRAEQNSYEDDVKKPKVPNREISSRKSGNFTTTGYDEWEFPRHKLRFVNILGEGCFGQVWKCETTDLEGAGDNKNLVAVKTLKESSGAEEQKDLLEELKVLKSLGHHPNVVSLLGCCTEKDPLFVILEYMSEGKLQSYLRSSRASCFYGNLHGKSSTLTPKDLTIFALQIAKGMDFLSKMRIVHRDLAARNVLVGEDKICKVADFGFARDVATNHVYERKSDGRMPIRWMAPESLHDNIFTTKSDVWSFGILLWEIVTLGSTPYPGISAAEVMKLVKEDYRLEKPDHCRREIYNIMYYCWYADPQDRPSFSELVQTLDSLILTEVEYIRLDNFPNRTYYNFTSTSTSGELL